MSWICCSGVSGELVEVIPGREVRENTESSTAAVIEEAAKERPTTPEPMEISNQRRQTTEEGLQSRLQDSLDSALQSGELQKALREVLPSNEKQQQEGTVEKLEQKQPEEAPAAPVESKISVPVKPAESVESVAVQSSAPLPLIWQSAGMIVIAVVLQGVALALPWWEHEDSAGHKTKIGLWHVEVDGSERSWGKYCIGVSPPECDDGPRTIVSTIIFISLLLAFVAALLFFLAYDIRRGAKMATICGLACLALSIILTIVSGACSMWYKDNTKLDTPGLAFYFIWMSALLMVAAGVVGVIGLRSDPALAGRPPADEAIAIDLEVAAPPPAADSATKDTV